MRPENARVGRGRSRWSTFLGKAVRVLAERRAVSGARDMFVLSAARSLGRDTRESGKRSNELQNCNTITAMTRNAGSPRLTHTHTQSHFTNDCAFPIENQPAIYSQIATFRKACPTFDRAIDNFLSLLRPQSCYRLTCISHIFLGYFLFFYGTTVCLTMSEYMPLIYQRRVI